MTNKIPLFFPQDNVSMLFDEKNPLTLSVIRELIYITFRCSQVSPGESERLVNLASVAWVCRMGAAIRGDSRGVIFPFFLKKKNE